MTGEEQALATWLRESAPEPPREIDVADIAARASGRGPRWLPILAAACVVALVAGLVLALRGGGSKNPPSRPTPVVTGTHSAPISPGPTRPPVPEPRPIGVWDGTQLGTVRIAAGTLAAIGGQLYGTVQRPAHKELVRLDPRTGAVLARSAAIGQQAYGPPVGASGLVWFQGAGSGDLLGFDPMTLDRRAHVRLDFSGAGAGFPATLAPGPDADTLLLGGQYRVAFIDTRNARVGRHLDVDGEVTGISLSPDGTRLYVASTPRLSAAGTLRVLDPNSGAVLDSVDVGGPALGLQATAGGLWLTVAGGHEAHIEFRPASDLAHPVSLAAGVSGGGYDVLPTVSGGVEWLGGYGAAGCADPETGSVRAQASFRPAGFLDAVSVLGGVVYAEVSLGDPNQSRLTVLHPPARCGIN